MENPDSVSVSVSISMEWTPGNTAKKSILTDWHADGRRGLKDINQQFDVEKLFLKNSPNPYTTFHR